MVDARFFGAHDKAWVPVKDCFLLSQNCPPTGNKRRTGDLDAASEEMHAHINNIKKAFGAFVYAKDRTQYVPEIEDKQLKIMMPGWQPPSAVGFLLIVAHIKALFFAGFR